MKFAATLIITLLMGCDIFDNEQNAVFGEIDNEELTVYNISGKDVTIFFWDSLEPTSEDVKSIIVK